MILALILQAASPGASAALAAPSAVAAPAKPAAVASASPDLDPNKKVCKSEEVTGSRVGGLRVCMTKAQWDERAAQAGAQLNGYQMSGMATSIPH